jgi:hypothetical protein
MYCAETRARVAGANAVVTTAVVVVDGRRRDISPHLSLPSRSLPASLSWNSKIPRDPVFEHTTRSSISVHVRAGRC